MAQSIGELAECDAIYQRSLQTTGKLSNIILPPFLDSPNRFIYIVVTKLFRGLKAAAEYPFCKVNT
jgi:hypothetical protein